MNELKRESIRVSVGEFSEISFEKARRLVAEAKAHHEELMLKYLIECMVNRLKTSDLTPRKRKEIVNGAIYLVQMIHQQSLQMDTKDLDKFVEGLSGARFNHVESSVNHSQTAKELAHDMSNLRHHFSKICHQPMTREIVSSFINDIAKIRAILDCVDSNDISECEIEHCRKKMRDYYLNAIRNSLDKSLKALESASPHLLQGFTNVEGAKKELMSLQDKVTQEIESLEKSQKNTKH